MLFMLTPEIKTNLILKEIGIKRYSLRSSNDQSQKKSLHFYKKGHILALLDKPYENFVREQQDLLIAIFSSTKIDNGEEVFKTIRYSSNNDLSSEFEEMSKNPKVVAIGESGLDYHYNISPESIQKKIFREQIELAQDIKIPIIMKQKNC